MKKLMLLVACLGFMATTVFAQNGSAAISSTPTGTIAKSTKKTQYICPKCKASSDKPGKCAKCNMKLVKEGLYYCPKCGATSTTPEKCTHCNIDMVKMIAATSPK